MKTLKPAWYQHLKQHPELLAIPTDASTHTDDGLPYADLAEVIEDREACFCVEAVRWMALLKDPTMSDFTSRDIKLSFGVLMALQDELDRLKEQL